VPVALNLEPADLYQLYSVRMVPVADDVDDGDQAFSVLVHYPAVVQGALVTVDLPVPLWNENIDRADVVRSRSLLEVNETGAFSLRFAGCCNVIASAPCNSCCECHLISKPYVSSAVSVSSTHFCC
jgi:hypothetical protein